MKRLINLGSVVLQVLSVVFIGHVVVQNVARIRALSLDGSGLAATIAGIMLICFFALALQVWACFVLMRGASASGVRAQNYFWMFGRTAIAKYIPGNLFHYVGRQSLAEKLGCAQTSVLAGSMAEIAVVIAAACTVAVVPTLTVELPVPSWAPPWVPTGMIAPILCAGALVPLATVAAARVISPFRSFSWLRPLAQLRSAAWLTAFLLYVVFILAGVSALTLAIAAVSEDIPPATILLIVFAYAASYVLGYVTPGAPGGIGIREALLVLLLSPEISESVIVFAAILHRICSIAAEAVLFASTFLILPVYASDTQIPTRAMKN